MAGEFDNTLGEGVSQGVNPLEEAKAQEALLDQLTEDFKRLQKQKARPSGSVEARILQNLCFVNGEHYVRYQNRTISLEAKSDSKLYLMFNMIGPRMNKLLGRLSGIQPPFKANPDKQAPEAYAQAEVVDRLIMATDQKLDQPSKNWELFHWVLVGGVAFEHTPWIPNASIEPTAQYSENGKLLFRSHLDDQIVDEDYVNSVVMSGQVPQEAFEIYEEPEPVGEVGSEILGPLNVFVDNSVRSIAEMAPDQRVYIAKIRTMGWIEETFGKQVEADKTFSIVSTQFGQPTEDGVGGTFLKDLIPLIQGSNDEADLPMAVVVDSYAPPSKMNPKGRYTVFCPGKEILYDGESPYGEIPLTDIHWKPVTTTFWTPDYVSDLIPPQKFINKRFSQLGEQSNATLYSNLLLGTGIEQADIPADFPGVVLNAVSETGVPLVQRLQPPQFPAWFMQSLELVIKTFNDIAGGADLFQESKFPGQLRGPMAVPMLQEILDTEWGPFFNHVGERLARIKQMRMNRVKEFYPAQRTLHYTDRNQKDEVLTFYRDKVLNSGINFNITVERGALLPELRALREARVMERLNGPLSILYVDERTGRLDKSKIAADLQFGDAGRESREAVYRKLAGEIVQMIQKGQPVPPVYPFYDHRVMLDEMEAAMATMEFLKSSPQIQQAFASRWEEHRQFMIEEAQAQQEAMSSGAINNAVAQATQQAAAQAASMAVEQAMQQAQAAKSQPTEEFVEGAKQSVTAATQDAMKSQPQRKERTITVKEKG